MTKPALLLLFAIGNLDGATVALAGASALNGPALHGIDKLSQSIEQHGLTVSREPGASGDFYILAGLSTSRGLAACPQGMSAPGAQSLAIRRMQHRGKPAVAICGGGPVGLMYAALELADRISQADAAAPFAKVRDTSERPFLEERGISMYTMQRAYFESRLFDENYWRRYFDLLARSRINTFTIIFGYENGGFMAPLYPYFFDVPEHSEVRLIGITKAQQERNTAALRMLIRLAQQRGIGVILAIWDHIYRGGVQGGGIAGASDTVGKDVPGLVSGVSAENLTSYTKRALQQFIRVFPEMDGLEFRMHSESGLKTDEMAGFWHDVFGLIARAKPGLRVTLRAKELPGEIIDDALRQGLHARVETKYWMEQMGLPFHPTHVNRQNQHDRRHGYADLLVYPQRYRVHWRLWSGGTTRLLLWADPEYVRRFAASARLYDGNSIDVNEMLATKMLGEPHEKPPLPIHNPAYRSYDYEFERYWHFYQLWGRLSYNPQTPADVWEQDFQKRFGPAGQSLMQGLHLASRILPRIVAASYRYQLFPTTRGWAEMMRQGDLSQFADAEGSDIEQFQSPRQAAKDLISETATSMRRPSDTSRWFGSVADQVLARVAEAERAGLRGNEAITTVADLKILAWLARFHAARLNAAVAYNLYRERKEVSDLDRAIEHEQSATVAWSEIVKAAGDVYSPVLAFGVHRVGFPRHWQEELEKQQVGLEKLVAERRSLPDAIARSLPSHSTFEREPPSIQLIPTGMAYPGKDLAVTVKAGDPTVLQMVRLRYRHLTQVEDYASLEMRLDPESGMYTAHIPGSFITPKWNLMYFVEAIGRAGNGRNYPDLETEAPYVIVPVQR